MPRLAFTVPGVPRGKGRPRFSKVGKFVKTFTDAKTEHYENRILVFFKQAAPTHRAIPKSVPVAVEMRAHFPIPASWSKRRKSECFEYLGKPDTDNIVKCLDALNAIAWVDDSQIWRVDVKKSYTLGEPRLEIVLVWGVETLRPMGERNGHLAV